MTYKGYVIEVRPERFGMYRARIYRPSRLLHFGALYRFRFGKKGAVAAAKRYIDSVTSINEGWETVYGPDQPQPKKPDPIKGGY